MSGPTPASATFFISGINHCELQAGQHLTLEHLRSLHQQIAEQAGRARALQQQLQQQAVQQGLRAAVAGGIAVKAEPGAAASVPGGVAAAATNAVKKEEDGTQQTQTAQQTQQLQYAALLALQLQQQQARAAAAAQAQGQAQARGSAGAPAAAAAFGGAPAALAHNVFPQAGVAARPGGPGLPQHGAAGGRGRGGHHGGRGQQAKQAKNAAAEEPATDQWVQCSKCQTWRQVPDEFWPDIENADEDEDWTCKDALWDVEDYEPNTPACC